MNDGTPESRDHYDPYHKLLGISKNEQPPTSYRLLGIETLEADSDVIDAAADRQMTYLHGCKNGEHAADAERLLNEVSEARLKLLDPQTKARYDQQLVASQRLSQARAQSNQAATTIDLNNPQDTTVGLDATFAEELVTQSTVQESHPTQPESVPQIHVSHGSRKSKTSSFQFWALGTIASCSMILLMAWKLGAIGGGHIEQLTSLITDAQLHSEMSDGIPPGESVVPELNEPTSDSPETNSQNQVDANTTEPRTVGPQTVGPITSRSEAGAVSVRSSANPNDPSNAARVTTEAGRKQLENFRAMGRDPTEASTPDTGNDVDPVMGTPIPIPTTTPIPISTGNDRSITPIDVRSPIPSEDKIDEATAEVQKSLASKIKSAQSKHEKQFLGSELVRIATDTKSPSQRYVLLQTAKDNLVQAGDFAGAMSAIDQLEKQFIISSVQERLPVIVKMEPMLYKPLDQVALADRAEQLIAEAVLDEDFNTAVQLCLLCKKLSSEMRNTAMQSKFTQKLKQNKAIQRAQSKVTAVRKVLDSDPENAIANEFLGRFHCFAKSDWKNGTAMLARSENSELRQVAKLEASEPTTTDAMDLVANAWWELSESSARDASLERESRRRAVHWYQVAVESGLKGLPRATAKARIDSAKKNQGVEAIDMIANADMRVPVRPRGVPASAIYFNGNWYEFSKTMRRFEKAVASAAKANARLIVIRSQAENDFIAEHARKPLRLGMLQKEGVWYDSLGERQHFFLWDDQDDQPDGGAIEPIAMMDYRGPLWHDSADKSLYYAVEWGRE